MLYHYMTVNCLGNLEVCHSKLKKDGTATVHFELPDKQLGFKELDCSLPSYEIIKNKGFNQKEIDTLMKLCRHNAHLIIQYAKEGGVSKCLT